MASKWHFAARKMLLVIAFSQIASFCAAAEGSSQPANGIIDAVPPSSPFPPIPILASSKMSPPPVVSSNAVTEHSPLMMTPPSAVVNVWSGGWMQLPGLISVPNWGAAISPGGILQPTGADAATALLAFPQLLPAAAAAAVENSILSSAFAPPALLAKRDEEEQLKQQREQNIKAANRTAAEQEAGRKAARQFVGIRVRFNPPIFEDTARLFYSVFNHEARHIQIRPQKQCFAEGCFHLHTFRISAFQRPRAITLKPISPNLLLLNILSFDVDIESLLNGSVQLLLTAVPITGNFFATARQLSISALFDLQKDQHKVPYLRIASCELRSGTISTKVSNLGLLTDSINFKYKTEMLEKAKELITSTICETISDTIRERVNHVLRRLPRAISVAKIIGAISSPDNDDCATSSLSQNTAFQLDDQHQLSQQHFYSNKLTLSYSTDRDKNGHGGDLFSRRREKRGMEIVDDETDNVSAEISIQLRNTTNNNNKHREIRRKEAKKIGKSLENINNINNKNLTQRLNNKNQSSAECSFDSAATLSDFLDLHSLGQLFFELDFMDSSAGSDFFAVGLSGDVVLKAPNAVSLVSGDVHELAKLVTQSAQGMRGKARNSSADEDKSLLMEDGDELAKEEQQQLLMLQHGIPPMLRFPGTVGTQPRKTLEIIFSDLSANLLLLQAYRAKLLKMRIGPNSAIFGPMLRTTCGPDEVCLSDSIPEAGEKHPNQQLEIEIEPVQAPRIKFSKELAQLNIVGAATFMLARNGQRIGRIPFNATVEFGIRTTAVTVSNKTNGQKDNTTTKEEGGGKGSGGRSGGLQVSLVIPKLELLEGVDFFGLSASMLEGFRDAVRGAILNFTKRALSSGTLPLEFLEKRLCPYGISRPGIHLLNDGMVLLDAELDAFVLLFDGSADGGGKQCSPTEY